MQRLAVPQSVSNTHCATAGRDGVWHTPLTQVSPMPQFVDDKQVAWQLPATQLRPVPHCALVWQSTSAASPQVLPPPV